MKYLSFILFIISFTYRPEAYAQRAGKDSVSPPATDSVATVDSSYKKEKAPKRPYLHQLRIGIDISRIPFNIMTPSKQFYEIQADYALRGKNYLVAEAGFGKGKVDYDNLKYETDGTFIRLGIDQSILDRLGDNDFDMAFIGARYGLGIGKRSDASYKVSSVFGSSAEGTIPASNYTAHWGEITAGIKVELWKGIFAGWNVRAKFLLNSGSFKELAPNLIPGYGQGDKSTDFGFNMYLCYSFRWMAPRNKGIVSGDQ